MTIQRQTVSRGDETTGNAARAAEQDFHTRRPVTHELSEADVTARFRLARARGRPRWLWPDVPVAEWRHALIELQRVVTGLLRNDSQPLIMTRAIPPGGLAVAAFTSGVGPWLGWQIEQGALEADTATADLFALHLDNARRRTRRMQAALDAVLALLRRAGVGVTVLKGMHTARAYFAEPALRPMADLDVLVDDVRAAEAALQGAGWTEKRSERHAEPYRAVWRSPDMPVTPRSLTVAHAEDPFALDLHGSLDIDFFGVHTVAFDRVIAPLRTLVVPGGEYVLAQPLLAAHHAVHASHGLQGLTLIRLVELTRMLRRDVRTRAEWSQLGELLRELEAERFAYLSFALVDKLAPGVVDAALLAQLGDASPDRLRRAARMLQPIDAQRFDDLSLSDSFLWARGTREHLRRLAVMLLPTRTRGPVRRLLRIYIERAYRLLRGRVRWRHVRP